MVDDEVDLLIVRGAGTVEELSTLGLPFASLYARASSVLLVHDGSARETKGHRFGGVRFVDVDSLAHRLTRALRMISDEYARAHEEHAHLAHSHVGKFLMFCHVERDARPMSVLDLLSAGDVDALERAARNYVESGFRDLYMRDGDMVHERDLRDPASPDPDLSSDPDARAGREREHSPPGS